MSSRSSSDGGREYKPIPPPKQQKNFASRRKSVKPKPSIPMLNKTQSSLTQMVPELRSTPREAIDISSHEEDGDYEEPPPKRRKKDGGSASGKKGNKGKSGKKTKLTKEKGQTTYTQYPYLTPMPRPSPVGVDEDGFQIWQDSGEERKDEQSEDELQHEAVLESDYEGAENNAPEIAESSQRDPGSEQQSLPNDLEVAKQRVPLQTPQKVRFVEIPSSQTPPATKLSTSRTARRPLSISRSPLKERSPNVQTRAMTLQSPESQNMSMKMLERVHFANKRARRKPIPATTKAYDSDEDLEQCAAEAIDEFSLRTCPMPPPPPKTLRRTTTVQDSQADSLDISIDTVLKDSPPRLKRTETIPDSMEESLDEEAIVDDSQQHRPRRKLRRVTTVQDSEVDDDDLMLEDDTKVDKDSGTFESNHQYDSDDERNDEHPEGTYDPAFSALDRDASRFTWTQTQHRTPVKATIADDSETEDEDLDRGCSPKKALKLHNPSDGASQELGDPVTTTSNPPPSQRDADFSEHEPTAPVSAFGPTAHHDDSAYESGDQLLAVKAIDVPSSPPPVQQFQLHKEISNDSAEGVYVPSSPPPLRPSQVSTVVPTQASIAARPLSPSQRVKAEPFSFPRHQQESQAFMSSYSPQNQYSLWQPESLSSSPLPLPPWSSPERRRSENIDDDAAGYGVGAGGELQLGSLADFSLPPPPPLSSSRRQTPASSAL